MTSLHFEKNSGNPTILARGGASAKRERRLETIAKRRKRHARQLIGGDFLAFSQFLSVFSDACTNTKFSCQKAQNWPSARVGLMAEAEHRDRRLQATAMQCCAAVRPVRL